VDLERIKDLEAALEAKSKELAEANERAASLDKRVGQMAKEKVRSSDWRLLGEWQSGLVLSIIKEHGRIHGACLPVGCHLARMVTVVPCHVHASQVQDHAAFNVCDHHVFYRTPTAHRSCLRRRCSGLRRPRRPRQLS
jgi:hypothetical protein